jgi:hypothetical protein
MQRFIIKTLGFIFIPLLTVVLSLLLFDNYLNQNARFKNYSFNTAIDSKIFKLPVNTSNNIIIAGDSRAERQLIPRIFKSTTGINSVNIAVSAGDLASTVPALTAFSDSNIFIISASSWQINDGSIDYGYLSNKCFQQFTLLEKIKTFRYEINGLIEMYSDLFKSTFNRFKDDQDKHYYNEKIIQEYGFFGIEDTLKIDTSNITNHLSSHAWYKKINSHGSRWRIFLESFEQLDYRNSLVIIYQPPVSPIWKEKTKNTLIGHFEKEYSKRLDSLCNKSDNIVFYDFYSQDITLLNNAKYYDYQHLNRNGAEIFSEIFSEKVICEINARTHNNVFTK